MSVCLFVCVCVGVGQITVKLYCTMYECLEKYTVNGILPYMYDVFLKVPRMYLPVAFENVRRNVFGKKQNGR